ncbi:hypothetical protein ACFPOB_25220 [Bosea eneae]|uniref:Uncharacterized protein n=1 Tax=Bosea eneae TaxID=151454 RepID=A0ABW0IX48_9HYPH
MTSRTRECGYESYQSFYTDVYGHALREMRPAGNTGAIMLLAEQTAGDCSDAPTPDLVIAALPKGRVGSVMDLGAGRFSGAMNGRDFIVIAPEAGTQIEMHADHQCLGLGVPYAALRKLAGEHPGLPADGDFGRLHTGLQRDVEVTRLLDRLWIEAACGNPHGALWADGALLQLVAALLRLRDGGKEAARSGLSAWRLRRVT